MWNASRDVRRRIDQLLDYHIPRGTAAVDIAEMLEQAMHRLRDMLAGQGIQLGQTQVQQQSQQQQQQGQPTFNGQGQQGQSSGQPRSGNGLVEGELTTSNPSLLVESTNGSGIDFYA